MASPLGRRPELRRDSSSLKQTSSTQDGSSGIGIAHGQWANSLQKVWILCPLFAIGKREVEPQDSSQTRSRIRLREQERYPVEQSLNARAADGETIIR